MNPVKHFAIVLGIIAAFVLGWLLVSTLNSGMAAVDDVLDPDATSSIRLPACATEDSPGPCFWDASEQGNGLGHDVIRLGP